MRRFDRPVEAAWRLSSAGDRVLEIVERRETLAGAAMLPGRAGGFLP
jgi:hypothetical protein